jgi:hypothetical protein
MAVSLSLTPRCDCFFSLVFDASLWGHPQWQQAMGSAAGGSQAPSAAAAGGGETQRTL